MASISGASPAAPAEELRLCRRLADILLLQSAAAAWTAAAAAPATSPDLTALRLLEKCSACMSG